MSASPQQAGRPPFGHAVTTVVPSGRGAPPYAPAELAAHNARLAAAGQVAEDLAADLHHGEVMAAHSGSPSPAEMIDRGVTPPPPGVPPAPGGSGHGAPGG